MSILTVVAVPLAAIAVAVAAPAHAAAPYPPPVPTVTVDQTIVPPGGTIVLTFAGFGARERVVISMRSLVRPRGNGRPRTVHLATVRANASGAGGAEVRIPRGARGPQLIVLTGLSTRRIASVQIVITTLLGGAAGNPPALTPGMGGSAGLPGTGLPNTGVPAGPVGVVAGALIVAGLIFVAGSQALRRRRAS